MTYYAYTTHDTRYTSSRYNTRNRNTLQQTLQHTATYCNTVQHTATHCNTLQHTTTHRVPTYIHTQRWECVYRWVCSVVQLVAVCCSLLQCVAACCSELLDLAGPHCNTATYHNTPQHTHRNTHTATHRNTLQHTATHCNIMHTHCNTLQHTVYSQTKQSRTRRGRQDASLAKFLKSQLHSDCTW